MHWHFWYCNDDHCISEFDRTYVHEHFIILHFIVEHCIAFPSITLHCIVLHCIVSIVLHCIALHCITLHCLLCLCDFVTSHHLHLKFMSSIGFLTFYKCENAVDFLVVLSILFFIRFFWSVLSAICLPCLNFLLICSRFVYFYIKFQSFEPTGGWEIIILVRYFWISWVYAYNMIASLSMRWTLIFRLLWKTKMQ